ncbi:hypothetical protein [Roseibium aggregatum]|uniref:Uncharacterized protein n=1 Tax=Roseibium aggregatum TaxID=187304 RepID=A0A939ECC1_9HYPH|nr:hypothetical protein [Roseibium aggregatum]MBN9670565.1 hypothetical protein [Roseibium aggregatum]
MSDDKIGMIGHEPGPLTAKVPPFGFSFFLFQGIAVSSVALVVETLLYGLERVAKSGSAQLFQPAAIDFLTSGYDAHNGPGLLDETVTEIEVPVGSIG